MAPEHPAATVAPPSVGTTETGVSQTPEGQSVPVAEEFLSLDEFAEATSPTAATTASTETAEESAARDDKGRFTKPTRHRARSQQAGSEDVPRIAELTRRLRETEAERDRLKASTAPPISEPPPQPRAQPQIRPAIPPPVKAAADDPEPDATKYTDLAKWMGDHSRWAAREENRAAWAAYEQTQQQSEQRAEATRLADSWRERVTAAKTKYPDFQQVALDAPTYIPHGSLIDAWILEHKSGADVLYHLQKHEPELRAMLALPLLDQVEALTLLAQRLTTAPRTAAVSTGAAPAAPSKPVARPPTPVRTAPMRTADEPPDLDDVSLDDFAQAYPSNGRR